MPSKKTPAAANVPAPITPLHEMAPRDRARTLLKFDETRAKLQGLAKESVTIKTADGKDNYDAVHAARMKLKNTRVAIQKAGKDARDDATKFSKEVIAVEKQLIDLISPEEERLEKLQKDADAAAEAERAAAAKREQERKEAIEIRILGMALAPFDVMGTGTTAADIEAKLLWLSEQDDETFEGEALERARTAKRVSMVRLRGMLQEAQTRERQERELEAARKEIADAQAALAKKAEELELQERTLTAKIGDVAEPHKVQPIVEAVLRETGDTLATADVPPKAQDPVQGQELPAAPATNRLNVPVHPMERIPVAAAPVNIEMQLRTAIHGALAFIVAAAGGGDEYVTLREAANTYFNTEEF
jgi:hypothetical protein